MEYETLDDGTLLTDEAVETLVASAYSALEKGAYTVIPNPHKKTAPLKLSEHRRAELLQALSEGN